MMTKNTVLENACPAAAFWRFMCAEDGATSIEYAGIIGLGAFLVIPALSLAGLKLADTFTTIHARMGAVDNTPTGSVPPPFPGYSPAAFDPGSPVEGLPPAPRAPELVATPIPNSP